MTELTRSISNKFYFITVFLLSSSNLCTRCLNITVCIHINVNGVLSTQAVLKSNGLKQGDPISCILYNFSLEPLLRSILDDTQFSGFHFFEQYSQNKLTLPQIKLLCCADDTLMILFCFSEIL